MTNNTPFLLWYGRKPILTHMRVLGSPCWVFTAQKRLGKFDSRGEPRVFLGYGKNIRAYKLLVKSRCIVIESMYVAINDARRSPYIDNGGFIVD